MKNLGLLCGYLAVLVSGASFGTMLTGALVLLPAWRSVPPAEFLSWFGANASRLAIYAGTLQSATIVLSLVGALVLGRRDSWMAAAFAIAVLATFPLYFRGANASFVSQSIALDQVPAELARWAAWHWIRTGFGLVAFALLLHAMIRARD
jgi:hypothetical protein